MASKTQGPTEPESVRNTEAKATGLTRIERLLGDRSKSNPGSPVQIRATVSELRTAIAEDDGRGGRMGHHWGTKLAWFWGVLADTVLERATFTEFLTKDLGLTVSQAYRYARMARYANADQSARGAEYVLACASLVDLFAANDALAKAHGVKPGPKTITDLGSIPLKLRSGKAVRIDAASAAEVEEALDLLRSTTAAGTARLPKAGRALQDDLREACRTNPDLAGVEARLRKGKSGTRLVLVVDPGVNLEKVGRVLARIVADRNG